MRRSRWSRDPILVNGKPKTAYITERDIEIFKLLARYRYLNLHYIHAFVGGNLTALRDRIDLLACQPKSSTPATRIQPLSVCRSSLDGFSRLASRFSP
jgi:hypothetical protein